MHRRILAAVAATAALAVAPAAAPAATQPQIDAAVTAGVTYLRATQDAASGRFAGGFNDDWALATLAATGVHPADVRAGGGAPSAQDYYLGSWLTDWYLESPSQFPATDFERIILNAHAAGLEPSRLSAQGNMVAQLAATYAGRGWFGDPGLFNGSLYGGLALNRVPVPAWLAAETVGSVRRNQHDDGGWTFMRVEDDPSGRASPSDIDMTGAALAGLCESGATTSDPAVAGGIAFLQSRLDPASGGFDHMFGVNANSAGWAIQGLNACGVDPQGPDWETAGGKTPVDYLLDVQQPDGGFAYALGDSTSQLYTTIDAVRGLAGGVFSADPPARANPADPVVRPRVAVPDGTVVPFALAIDDGRGGRRFCRVDAAAEAPLTDVLAAAQAASLPAGCVTQLTVDGGAVTALNGASAGAGGGWKVSLDGAAEQPAGAQPVAWGTTIALRLDAPLTDAGGVPSGSVGAARPFELLAVAGPLSPGRARIVGAQRDDFLVSADDCDDAALAIGESCAVNVRFAPSEQGVRGATLEIAGGAAGGGVARFALTGTGTAPGSGGGTPGPPGETGPGGPAGPAGRDGATGPSGSAGRDGVAGPAGPVGATGPAGPAGKRGATGRRGARGRDGRDARVSCRLTGHAAGERVVCRVTLARGSARKAVRGTASARLVRGGHTFARGALARLRSDRSLQRGRYTLRVRTGATLLRIPVTVR